MEIKREGGREEGARRGIREIKGRSEEVKGRYRQRNRKKE